MPDLVEQKVRIGTDAYGREVTAVRSKTYDGKIVWTIVSAPVSQRDEGERMSGLTDDNLRDLIEALNHVNTTPEAIERWRKSIDNALRAAVAGEREPRRR